MDYLEIELYALPSGKEPYIEWESKLNKDTQAVITARLARLRGGNFGDSKSIENGI
jgi:putative component of toxin-antitoxin plasmid stabilization module